MNALQCLLQSEFPASFSSICFLHLPCLCMFSLTSNPIVPLLWLSMQNYLGLGSGHSCPCSACKRKRMDGAVWVRSQNLKSVSAVSAVVPSISKNIPNTASRGRGSWSSWRRDPVSVPGSVCSSCGCVTVEDAYGRAHWGPFNGFSHLRVWPALRASEHTGIQMLCLKNYSRYWVCC